MYMYINFQQNRVNTSVRLTVHTNLFAKNRKLHKFAATTSIFLNRPFQTCIILKRTCMPIFSKIGLVYQSKSCIQNHLQKNVICNLQLEFRKNHVFRTFRPIWRSIRVLCPCSHIVVRTLKKVIDSSLINNNKLHSL